MLLEWMKMSLFYLRFLRQDGESHKTSQVLKLRLENKLLTQKTPQALSLR